MRMAISEASKSLGQTSPNPAVGAVIVKNERILAKGHHLAAGKPHAEIEALRKLTKGQQKGATLYVTLEPCCSYGRTPPCTDAIINAGIARVVYGATDPDKRHRGRASKILQKAGIMVLKSVLESECSLLNAHWNHRVQNSLPWVIAKAGMSLDGRIDSPPRRRWITSAASRIESMLLRASVDAILVGGNTVRTDNPSLTIRGIKSALKQRQPWRVIWSRSGILPKKAKLFTDKYRDRTLLFKGTTLRKVLRELAKRGVSSLLIEGGGKTLGEAFARQLVDEIRFFIAPVIQGGSIPTVDSRGFSSKMPAAQLTNLSYKKIGSDLMISGKVLK